MPPSFTTEASCNTLRGKQLLFAGDSTMWQLFLSFVLMHGGQLGRNMVMTSAATDLSASVCDDQVRAVFVRSDLLLWSNHHWEYTQARPGPSPGTLAPSLSQPCLP